MVVVNLMGGLGNQMFQYAAGKSFALKRGIELKYVFNDSYSIAIRSVKIDNFNISGVSLKAGEAEHYFPKRKFVRRFYKLMGWNCEGKKVSERQDYQFDTEFLSAGNDVLLYGFWQSYLYFKEFEDVIRDEFTLKFKSENFIRVCAFIDSMSESVSVHVRRGDYLVAESGFSPLTMEYYEKAFKAIANVDPAIVPVVFTDDADWVKSNFNFLSDAIFISDFHLHDFEELIAMSHCTHHIIANSSFSWWGAWLNPRASKTVVAPSNWHRLHNDESSLIPENWIKI